MKNNWSTPSLSKNVSPDMIGDEYLETEVVILLQGTNLFGNPVYSYLKLTGKALREMFVKMKIGENFKPSDFGTVLAAGTGLPSEEVREEMKNEYNLVDVVLPKQPAILPNFQPKFFDDN